MGEKFQAWEGSITAAIYWNDLKIYWNLFKWFLEIEIPILSCISASVIWKGKEISQKAEIHNINFCFLEWNSHFDEIGWNGQSSLAAAYFIVFGHFFKIVLGIWAPGSSFAATYCMRGFLTYLSQSLEGEGNAKEVGTGSICVDYILYFREILTYILRPNISDSIELHFIFYGNILWMLWKHSRLNRWGRQLTQSKKNVNFYCNQFKRCPPHTCRYIPKSNTNNQRKIWTISVCVS